MPRLFPPSFYIVIGFICLLNPPAIRSAKILFLVPISTRSEIHIFDVLSNALALNGHLLTVVTPKKSAIVHANVTEIMPISVNEVFPDRIPKQVFVINEIFYDISHFAAMCEKVYTFEGFKSVLEEKYDLIFTNALFSQCFYGVIYKNQSPFILLNSFPMPNYYIKDLGSHAPTSTVPYPILNFADEMNFRERLINYVIDWATYAFSELYFVPLFESLYRKHLGQDLPSVTEIQRNVSLVMTNSHFTSTYPRPLLPDNIEIGGIHCKDPEPLPKDLEDFVSGSEEGFIFFSFGTLLPGSNLQKEIRDKFVHVLSKLKQRVLWKFETESVEGLSSNVRISKWLPQQDLLGHPKIRLFIAHGGLLSTQEAIYHKVPTLLFPLFFDQNTNAANAVKHGYALKLDLWTFTEAELLTSINRLLDEPKFQENAKTISSVYRDQLSNPLERAVFWTNFVLKHKGAPQLRSSGRNLNFIQFHSIDVIAFIVVLIIAVMVLIFSVIRTILSILFLAKNSNKRKRD